MLDQYEIKYEKEKNRSAAYFKEEEIGECVYSRSPKVWIINHTFVEPDYESQGIARLLVEKLLDRAKNEDVQVDATCPYAIWLFEEVDYGDIVLL